MQLSKYFLVFSLAVGALAAPQAANAQSLAIGIGVSIHTAPPALPVYVQPPCPTPGYLWTPGYWGYRDAGYYWVPGVWVSPPYANVLWTPGYWGYDGAAYAWHGGYWGPHVGFYGGVNYGFGYGGVGFVGGMWSGGVFRYNTAVVSVNTAYIHNTYVDRTVINNVYVNNHVSYNGPGGITARPTPEERGYAGEQHYVATPNQYANQRTAGANPGQFANNNHGAPQTAAMNEVNGRRYDQQGRIANGVGAGQLTPGETGRLENRESNLNSTIRDDRTANGGTLTPQERANVNARQNNISGSIYNDRHNAATQHYGDTEVGQRRYDQQQRIAHGVGSGQITDRGAASDEAREQNINRSVRADRAANGGRLTPQQHAGINQRQNNLSRRIYTQKHNEPHAPR